MDVGGVNVVDGADVCNVTPVSDYWTTGTGNALPPIIPSWDFLAFSWGL